MSWFLSLILAGSMVTTGSNLPVAENNVYQNQKVPVFKQSETERFSQTYPFNPNGRIQVSNLNGSIKVEAWDRDEIFLEAIKYASSKDRLSEVKLIIHDDQNDFKVETDYEEWNRRANRISKSKRKNYGSLKVEFRLKVPRTAMLNDIQTVNGSISVANMTKYTEVSAVNGQVQGTNLRGTAKLSTVNGGVIGDFKRLENKSMVALETVNGSVKLLLPSDANAIIRADTLNGSIKNAFGLPVKKGDYVGHDLYGRIGDSGIGLDDYSKFKLSSVNGRLSIMRQNDGKSLSPATNLLPQKGSDEFDSDFQAELKETEREGKLSVRAQKREARKKSIKESRRGISKMNGDLRRVAKISDAKVRESLKGVTVDVGKIAPDISRITSEALDAATVEIDAAKTKKLAEEANALRDVFLNRGLESQMKIPAVDQENGVFKIKGSPVVSIEAEDAEVSVRGWDRPEVKYTVTKITKNQALEEENEGAVTFSADQTDSDEVEFEVKNDSEPGRGYRYEKPTQIRLEVFVPKKSSLRIITNHELRLECVDGEIDVQGKNKTLNLRDIKGNLILRSRNGLVRLIGFDGQLDSEIRNGEMYLEGRFTKINSKARRGKITLTVPEKTNATLTTNGIVDFEDVILRGSVGGKRYEPKTLLLGKGGANYNFAFERGSLVVREKKSIYVN